MPEQDEQPRLYKLKIAFEIGFSILLCLLVNFHSECIPRLEVKISGAYTEKDSVLHYRCGIVMMTDLSLISIFGFNPICSNMAVT